MAEGYRQPFWEDGPRALVCGFWASESCLHDLKRAPSAVLDKPCHTLFLYLPRGARDAIADEANVPRICDLSQPGTPLTTPLLRQPALRPQVSRPSYPVVCRPRPAGGRATVSRLVRGGRAPRQERRAKVIAANLDGAPVKELARECRLSGAQFSRAFRRSLGMAPHNGPFEQRVLSKKKLRDDRRRGQPDRWRKSLRPSVGRSKNSK